MSVTILSQKQLSNNSWALTWSSSLSSPLFYIYENGILTQTTPATSRSFSVSPEAQLSIEILDNATQKPSFVYSGVAVLGWYSSLETASYRIEQWSGSAWDRIDTLPETGAWWLTWVSPFLPDCQPYSFRVTPIGNNGNAGNAQVFNGFMVRIPDTPINTFTLNIDLTLTIN